MNSTCSRIELEVLSNVISGRNHTIVWILWGWTRAGVQWGHSMITFTSFSRSCTFRVHELPLTVT